MGKSGRARVGVDIGGTFTDFAIEIGGRRLSRKVLTTAAAPEKGVLEGLAALLEDAGLSVDDVGLIIHGTTLATNALIERKGARTAFVTTDGFRDIVESGFESRYEQYDLTIDLPKPLVPRRWRFSVPERIDSTGRIHRPLDTDAVKALVPQFEREGIEAVAIGFLHSYINSEHENAAHRILQDALPGLSYSLSSVVSPEMREYERFSTACANAYVQPRMATYLQALEVGLSAAGIDCPLLLMLSSGGLTTIETASRFPVRLVESGPAGGAIFSSHIARQCEYEKVLSFDMGGTTAKICLIDDFVPQTSRLFEVARVYRFRKGSGLPLRIPVIEMVEIGAGGGSIARVDSMNRITVGPDSAGSEPGPACYQRGGDQATVTDADLMLGRIDPEQFAGGKVPLDPAASGRALAANVGDALGSSDTLAAFGISEVVDENMANAARVHAIESGKDVTKRTLIAFGGAAPLHASRVAEKLNVSSFVVPTGAGVGSAVGFLQAPVAYEIVQSDHQRLQSFDLDRANGLLRQMTELARTVVEPAAFGSALEEKRMVFMRYVGQGHEISIPAPTGPILACDIELLRKSFEEEYGRLYSRTVPASDVEILTWVVKVTAGIADAQKSKVPAHEPYQPKPTGKRRIFDSDIGKVVSVPVFQRESLKPGATFSGPAIVVESETTTIVSDKFKVHVNNLGYLECTRHGAH
ncbi:MAG: hydantoinase/oxoprolinase family protein [Proteobacteria bacterium]|nr:hydantoinase/oxoprolinase family protein [Pseudomonadota bacterium]